MHGQIAATLSHHPTGSNDLVVTGTIVAETPADLATPVEITVELPVPGGDPVTCSTNGNHGGKLYATWPPGTTWGMNASTRLSGDVTANATACDDDNGSTVLAQWSQAIQILP